jgi:hypothetical protein
MKRFASIALTCALLLAFAATAMGAVGWCGNIWPRNGIVYTSNDNIDCYVQIWKDGCTGPTSGPCPNLAAYIYYRCAGGTDFTEVPMAFLGFNGNNDEYKGTIPAGHGCSEVEYYIKVVDLTDMAECYGNDQWNNPPNFFLPITAVTAQDVTVTFHLCLPYGVESFFDVFVTGSHPQLTSWGNGVLMGFSCEGASPKLYEVDVMFPAGSNPYVEYKYRKDSGATWDCDPNHQFTIDGSGPTQDLWLDAWCWGVPDCPDCTTAVENTTWGTIKAIYR